MLQNQHLLVRMAARWGKTCVVIGKQCCFNVKKTGDDVMSHLNHLKEQTNILHPINEAQLFHWTRLRNRRLERFNGTWEPCVWICSLLLTHCYNLCYFLLQISYWPTFNPSLLSTAVNLAPGLWNFMSGFQQGNEGTDPSRMALTWEHLSKQQLQRKTKSSLNFHLMSKAGLCLTWPQDLPRNCVNKPQRSHPHVPTEA